MSLQSESGRKNYEDSDTSPQPYPKGEYSKGVMDITVDVNRRGWREYPGKGIGNPTGLGKVSQ